MNFLSFEFLAAFGVFLLLYWLPFNTRYMRNTLLICASYSLITLFNIQFSLLLLGYSLFIYLLANHADRFLRPAGIYTLLTAAIIGLFTLFKYYAFFQESIQHTLALTGLHLDLPTLSLLLPVGLSYYSFHSVSYVVSVQKGEIEKARLDDLMLYLCFFPSIIAGPINRARYLLPQIRDAQRILLEPARALFLIALAMIKLFLCSAWLSQNLADPVFADPGGHDGGQNLLAVYAYAWTIYFNFSGYTDLVTGLALLLGFRLPANFNAPYLAQNLREFWNRWHISLSSFIRDYLYIPLGGGRYGFWRTSLNVLVAMVLSGLWHGAAATFIVWGALHALGVIVHNLWLRLFPAPSGWRGRRPMATLIARLLCFHFVCLAWIFFRSDSLDNALLILQRILTVSTHTLQTHGSMLAAAALMFLAYPQLVRLKQRLEVRSETLHWSYYPVALALVLSLAFSLAPAGMPSFIYASF